MIKKFFEKTSERIVCQSVKPANEFILLSSLEPLKEIRRALSFYIKQANRFCYIVILDDNSVTVYTLFKTKKSYNPP